MMAVTNGERLHRANRALTNISLRIQGGQETHPEQDAQKLHGLVEDIQYIVDMYLDQEELHQSDTSMTREVA